MIPSDEVVDASEGMGDSEDVAAVPGADESTCPDRELTDALQLEAWEQHAHSRTAETSHPEGVDSNAIRAAMLLKTVFGSDAADAPEDLPDKFGRFVIRGRLGAGRFGVVWRAFDPDSSREVAVKVIQQSLMLDDKQRRRFLRECSLAARLDHRGIVPVYETGLESGVPYLVMPVCEGPTLESWLARQVTPLAPEVAAEIARQLADAAAAGHRNGVLHRDLKPGNVVVNEEGSGMHADAVTVRVLDFGLAVPLDASLRDTRGSLIAGTPLYMAPEQVECRVVDIGAGTDIFAIGAMLYEMLTGRPPFHAETLLGVIDRLLSETAAPLRRMRRDIPADLEAICLKCLSHDPRDRYAAAAELATDLGRFFNDETVIARPMSRLQRFLSWCSLRHGRQQLALAALVINVVILVWSVVSLGAAYREVSHDQSPLAALVPTAVSLFGVIVPLHVTLIWLALRIRNQQSVIRGSLTGLALSVLTFCYAAGVLLGILAPVPSPAYEMNTLARDIAFTLVSVGFGMLSVLYGLLACAGWSKDVRK